MNAGPQYSMGPFDPSPLVGALSVLILFLATNKNVGTII